MEWAGAFRRRSDESELSISSKAGLPPRPFWSSARYAFVDTHLLSQSPLEFRFYEPRIAVVGGVVSYIFVFLAPLLTTLRPAYRHPLYLHRRSELLTLSRRLLYF